MQRKLGLEYYIKRMVSAKTPMDFYTAWVHGVFFSYKNVMREVSHAITFAL